MPRWFRNCFAVVMLCAAAVLAWCLVDTYSLRLQLDDAASSLDFSRQREYKQQYEYDQAAAAIPEVMAQVHDLEPRAAAAKQTETDLRARRKQLRAENSALSEQLAQAQAELADARAQAKALADALCADVLTAAPEN